MAIYHFSAKTVSRSAGQSAVAKAAYNARDKLTDERTGEVKNYSRKDGLVFSGLYAPTDAPDWAQDRGQLWNHAEAAEKRKDATLAREYQIALPHELTDEQRRFLVQDFVKENFTRKGYAADVNIHAPDREGDDRNYHAHVLVTDRKLGAEGFAASKAERQGTQKARTEELESLRESWERIGNRHLERHGHAPSLDRRTLAAQGIEREPTQHLGPLAMVIERDGRESHRGRENRVTMARNAERQQTRADLADVSREIDQAQAPDLGRATTPDFAPVVAVATKAADKAADIAAELLDILGPAPRKVTADEYLASQKARQEYFRQKAAEEERNATLDKIIHDRKTGRNLNPEDLRNDLRRLGRDDLETIKAHGDDGIKRLIDERERQERAHRRAEQIREMYRDMGRERER